eukprot:jgi/Undpi1/1335/HiC_scaffold_11.g04727.m1
MYEDGESVVVWVNKVGPWYNPQESYPYYRLPYCVPHLAEGAKKKRPSGLGEILAGNELRNSGIDIKFKGEQQHSHLASWGRSVEENYLANIYVDDLPMYGPVGKMVELPSSIEKEARVYLTQRYIIHYNENRIIRVVLEMDNLKALTPGDSLDFSFEVEWEVSDTPFDKRFDFYLDPKFFEHQIHWFSIFNAFMMVIFLCGLVSLILVRTLKNDFAKVSVHGDVFRAPKHLMVFSAFFGTGCQLSVLVLVVVLFAIAGPLHGDVYEERGEMVSTFIWQKTMILSVILVPAVVLPVVFVLNLVAMHYNTVNTIPFMAVLKMALIWLFVSFPLCVVGSMFGRHWGGKGNFPCRVNSIPRPIPEGAWYSQPSVVVPLAGILPFGSIFIEMYFILTSLWGYMYYYVYGFMLLVMAILVVVLVCTSIVAVYFVLNAENYHWQWVSFLSAGSTAVYVFLYSAYYLWFKTHQNGFIQLSFYFGYMGLFCAALAVMCGSIGVMGSTVFVKQIYRNLKVD